MVFYQKALSPGAECHGNKLHGVVPPAVTVEEVTALCSEGYSEIYDFRMGRRKWLKQAEVFYPGILSQLPIFMLPYNLQYNDWK